MLTTRSSEGLGLGRRVLKFTDTKGNWEHCGRTIDLRGGHTYLYTAWVRNRDMGGGSNIYQNLTTGEGKPLYDSRVFMCGKNNAHWQVFTCCYRAPEDLKSAGFTPVVKGKGWALLVRCYARTANSQGGRRREKLLTFVRTPECSEG